MNANDALTARGKPVGEARLLRIFLLQQTLIGVAINALIPTAVIWLLKLTPPATAFGSDGLLPGMMLASGLATLLMTPAVTFAVRAALRKRPLQMHAGTDLDRVIRQLPRNLPARAFLLGGLAMLIIVPCFLFAIAALPILPLTHRGFILWNVVYGATVGATVTPIAVLRAIAEGPNTLHRTRAIAPGDHPP